MSRFHCRSLQKSDVELCVDISFGFMDFRINWILLSAYITFWNHPWTDRIKSKIIPKGFGTDFAQISRDYREEKSDVTFTMVAKFLDHSKRELRQRERRCISKTITLHVHHSFSTFFSHRCTTATWNFLISPARFTELVNATRKVSFSLSKLRYGPFGFNLEHFANIWQSEWNWMRSMKFETARIYFLSEFSVCCHPKVLLPWQRDETTSL